jgi:predicted HTH domain antitoxin
MAKVTLEIPESVQSALKVPPEEVESTLRQELALTLYQRQILGLGKAQELAGLTRWQFEELLGARRIRRHYDDADLAEDLRFGFGD